MKIVEHRSSEAVYWRGRLCLLSTLPSWDLAGLTLKYHKPVKTCTQRASAISFGEKLWCGAKPQRQYSVFYRLARQELLFILWCFHVSLYFCGSKFPFPGLIYLFINTAQINSPRHNSNNFLFIFHPPEKPKAENPWHFSGILGRMLSFRHAERC